MIALLDHIGRAIDAAPTFAAAQETAAAYREHGITLHVAGDQPDAPTIRHAWLQPYDIRDYRDLAAITAPPLTTRRHGHGVHDLAA